ncbi:hypothetical protein CEXT_215431 [Caerostris extrusa]|uniref:Uncharacterized protein n=1 Tax=Caerostris extrusa TaxID=172846 RepID=A0AAV4Q3H7_CAEEX|nr:hypothetical protein CEXT_215431 [Caerostris extrusa]
MWQETVEKTEVMLKRETMHSYGCSDISRVARHLRQLQSRLMQDSADVASCVDDVRRLPESEGVVTEYFLAYLNGTIQATPYLAAEG